MDDTAAPSDSEPTTLEADVLTGADGQSGLVAAIYLGWAALIWFSQFAGLLALDSRSAKILLLGACATNVVFFLIARSKTIDPVPADSMTLVQCIVGIAWATVFTFLSTGAGFISIGIYVSIILFAMFRVTQPVLHQVIVFAVIAYSMMNFCKLLISDSQAMAADYLFQVMIFGGIMACVTSASRYVYQQQQKLETRFTKLQQHLRGEQKARSSRLFSRPGILDALSREKARTDRKNVPFCICIFKAEGIEPAAATDQQLNGNGSGAWHEIEAIIRASLRDMDSVSVSVSEFHDGFDSGQENKFLVVLPETNLSGARCSAERVLATVTAQLDETGKDIRLACGLAQYQRGESIANLLERAERALEQAFQADVSTICDHSAGIDGHRADSAEVIRFSSRRP